MPSSWGIQATHVAVPGTWLGLVDDLPKQNSDRMAGHTEVQDVEDVQLQSLGIMPGSVKSGLQPGLQLAWRERGASPTCVLAKVIPAFPALLGAGTPKARVGLVRPRELEVLVKKLQVPCDAIDHSWPEPLLRRWAPS